MEAVGYFMDMPRPVKILVFFLGCIWRATLRSQLSLQGKVMASLIILVFFLSISFFECINIEEASL